MTPADIVTEVITLGIGEAQPDNDLLDKVYVFFNMYYQDLLNEISTDNLTDSATSQTVSMTAATGLATGTLNPRPRRILQVQHVPSKAFLTRTDLVEALKRDPSRVMNGIPQFFWVENRTTIKTQGPGTTGDTLLVQFIPTAPDLASTSTEADIQILPEFHSILVWGTLQYLNTFERGFSWQIGLADSTQRAEVLKNRLKTVLFNESRQATYVKTYY